MVSPACTGSPKPRDRGDAVQAQDSTTLAVATRRRVVLWDTLARADGSAATRPLLVIEPHVEVATPAAPDTDASDTFAQRLPPGALPPLSHWGMDITGMDMAPDGDAPGSCLPSPRSPCLACALSAHAECRCAPCVGRLLAVSREPRVGSGYGAASVHVAPPRALNVGMAALYVVDRNAPEAAPGQATSRLAHTLRCSASAEGDARSWSSLGGAVRGHTCSSSCLHALLLPATCPRARVPARVRML